MGPQKSVPLSRLIPLLQIPSISYISAQKVVSIDDAKILCQYGVERPEINSFKDTVRILETSEMVISIDTGVAHLAASMGIPTWVLLHFLPDWRWFIDRSDSPWYPSVTLFRQDRRNDWDGPIQQIAERLRACLKSSIG